MNAMQFGRTFFRLLSKILHANPVLGPTHVSKIDLADGYMRVPLSTPAMPQLAFLVPPHPTDDEQIIGFHLSLPMGFGPSCPYFASVTETVVDICNNSWDDMNNVFPHRLGNMANTIPLDPQVAAGVHSVSQNNHWTSVWKSLPPNVLTEALKYVVVYVDDHLLLAQGPPERREAVRDKVMHTLDKVFCHSSIDNNMRSDPISHKKLLKGDAAWSTCQKILGWLIDTVAMTVTLPLEKVNKVVSQLRNCLCLKRLGYKRVQRLLGLLRSVVSAIPGGLGLFTSLKHALSLPRRIRINDALHEELKS